MLKKKLFLISGIFLILFLTVNVFNVKAHSPSSMSLSYNSNTQTLTVSISHSVSNPSTHFVESVEVLVNSSSVLTTPYTSQPSPSSFSYEYTINANIGATIQVIASCNQGGDITRSITISEDNGTNNGSPTIPSYYGIWIILLSSMAIIIINIKYKFGKKKD
jgi:hypothetical protein